MSDLFAAFDNDNDEEIIEKNEIKSKPESKDENSNLNTRKWKRDKNMGIETVQKKAKIK